MQNGGIKGWRKRGRETNVAPVNLYINLFIYRDLFMEWDKWTRYEIICSSVNQFSYVHRFKYIYIKYKTPGHTYNNLTLLACSVWKKIFFLFYFHSLLLYIAFIYICSFIFNIHVYMCMYYY